MTLACYGALEIVGVIIVIVIIIIIIIIITIIIIISKCITCRSAREQEWRRLGRTVGP